MYVQPKNVNYSHSIWYGCFLFSIHHTTNITMFGSVVFISIFEMLLFRISQAYFRICFYFLFFAVFAVIIVVTMVSFNSAFVYNVVYSSRFVVASFHDEYHAIRMKYAYFRTEFSVMVIVVTVMGKGYLSITLNRLSK